MNDVGGSLRVLTETVKNVLLLMSLIRLKYLLIYARRYV